MAPFFSSFSSSLNTLDRKVIDFSRRASIREANDGVKRMESELTLLKAVLHEMDRNQGEIHLKRQIKELIYVIQDIIESWQLIHLPDSNTTKGNRSLGRALEREIKSIVHWLEKIDLMNRVYKDHQLQPTQANQVPSVQLNVEVPPIRQNKIVCFEEDENILISYLKEETDEVDVVSIVGMPGIGKTRLAWKIYQNKDIRSEFSTRIWVDISHDFRSKDLYLNIIKEYLKKDMVGYKDVRIQLAIPSVTCDKETYLDILDAFAETGRFSDDQLIRGVRACLENKKFLLVVDNVWTADSLRIVMSLLPKGSKMLITTCSTRVCHDARVRRKPHELSLQSLDTSWELLQWEVFGKLNVCPETLKSTGKVIAQSCGGLPLAIAVVGAKLGLASSAEAAQYLNEQRWKKVSENVTEYITQDDGDQHNVFGRVNPSYIKLTQQLQDCFLYLGVFPQDYEIHVSTLTRLWIAEGLVQSSQELSSEESAERNLDDLVSRNLVVAGKPKLDGKIKTCSLHKVMYGFCKYKAAEQEFYHEIKMSGRRAIEGLISLALNHRRLCINSHLSEFFSTTREERQVRSLLCLNNDDEVILHPNDISSIHESFKLLKIFECKGVKFSKFPITLSKLMNLRYISVCCDDVIPESISCLCYLETLVVHTESPSIEVKANIWRMLKLRHLVTKAAIVLAIRGKGEVSKDLHTLTRLAPASCTKDVFTKAPNLNKLGIRGELDSSNKLERLQNLKPADIQLALDCFPTTLKRLTLSGTCLKWESMSTLGKIGSLEILKLKNHAFVGESWTSTAADGFGRLRFLLIKTTCLKSWVASDDCFPSLEHLVLNDCEDLLHFPSAPPKNLDKLDVDGEVSQSANQFAMEIKEKKREQRQKGHNQMSHQIPC